MSELGTQALAVDSDACAHQFMAILCQRMLNDNISIQAPIIVARASNLLRRCPIGHRPAHSDDEYRPKPFHCGRLPLMYTESGKHLVQFLRGNKRQLLWKAAGCCWVAFEEDVWVLLQDVIFAVRDYFPDFGHILLQSLCCAVFLIDAHFEIPLIRDDTVCHISLVPFANADRIAVDTLANIATESIEHKPLPFGKRLDNLTL
mmetsp:Transcript_10483/g.24652  ORF Transcript_10483/g.24652 Transcript_10483/m.24652 type:complete len:203 (-) Transcript_10483:450-1058(-)